MGIALYHPVYGYYSNKEVFEEDYITASRFDIFADGIRVAFEDMLEKCNGNTIVEFGAGDGKLAELVLKKLDVDYIIVEKSENMRKKAEKRLKKFESVKFVDEDELKEYNVNGIVFSNEFFDALPVNVVIKKDSLKEVYVDVKDGRFVEILKEPSTPEIEEYFKKLNIELEDDSRAEVNLDAVKYITLFGKILDKGFVMTVDYGFPSEELYTLERRGGTIVCYTDHTYNYDPYINIGEQDITSHVNFSALVEFGSESGLDLTGLTNHLYFLMSTLGENGIENYESAEDFKFLAFRMGTFKILIQHKGIARPYLKCLKMTPSFGYWNRYNYQGQLKMEFLEE
ncbi:MAG TPA: SAM-dependent methyltransferase [Archaeoglobaceae archaeon]|nr:SAM-dependent methyltransferase [Archaeoglobaceae archaeon]